MDLLWIAGACLTLAAAYAVAHGFVRSARRLPPGLTAPLAFALVVAFEAVLLEALSLAHAVTRAGVLAAHVAALGGAVWLGRRRAAQHARSWWPRARRRGAALGLPGLLLIPLAFLVASSALRYAPNNQDSMTYHLARVAHWLQHGSVEAYATNIPRQIAYGPGAEYLLLVLQVVSGSDALAALVQLAAWVVIALAAPALARCAGAPRAASAWAAPLVAAAPMLVLQASSTQNDLVSAVMTVAIAVAASPFLHRAPARWRTGDVLLLAAACASGVLVKPLSAVVALPFLAVAGFRIVAGLARVRARLLAALAAGLLLSSLVVGPALVRAARSAGEGPFREYLFPLVGEWSERAVNLARGAAHHVPLPRAAVVALGLDPDDHCGAETICTRVVMQPHEDFRGNPVQLAVLVVLVAAGAARWRRMSPRGRAALAMLAAAWVVFHLVVRENVWISRLQTPLFALMPLALGVLGGLRGHATARIGGAVAALAALALGYAAALENHTRPPLGQPPWAQVRHWSYYANSPSKAPLHDETLAAARGLRCDRLGLWIGGDSFDYPLTWRAMQEGISVRHVVARDAWPCVIFSDRGPPPGVAGVDWVPTSEPYLFVNPRALAGSGAPVVR